MAVLAACIIAEDQVVLYLLSMFFGLVFPVFNVPKKIMLLKETTGRAAPIFSEFGD